MIDFIPDDAAAGLSPAHLLIGQLALSPFNVRTNQADATATAALEASILADGLLHALQVHPLADPAARGTDSVWGVFAGGRRLRSIQNLISRGALPTDYLVRVDIHAGYSDGQLIEKSLAENMLRRDLRDYELCAGIRRAFDKGERIESIAQALGQEPATVKRWLRIGQLAAPIFDALKAEQISLDQARAYGAIEDEQLQRAAFEHFQPLQPWEKTPERIRAWLKVGDRELDRLLRFVGEQAYRDAGGAYALDLFADDAAQRGRVTDENLLRRMAEERLANTRADLRRRVGRDVRFVPKPPQNDFDFADFSLHIDAKRGEDDDSIVLPDGDVVGCLTIGEAGEPEVSWWWASRAAKYGNQKTGQKTLFQDRTTTTSGVTLAALSNGAALLHARSPAALEANAAIREEEGLAAETVEIMKSMRRAIMRAALVDEATEQSGAIGRDYFIWSQLRALLDIGQPAQALGVVALHGLDAGPEGGREFVAAMPAAQRWGLALSSLTQRPFMSNPDLPAAFRAYMIEPEDVKDLAGAVLAGLTLCRSLAAPGYDLPIHDELAAFLDLHDPTRIRSYWTPTEALLERIPVKQRLAIAEPFVERAAFAPWSRQKGAEITRLVLGVVTGKSEGMRETIAALAARWVHPLLAFGAAPGTLARTLPATDDPCKPIEANTLREAAE
ncbi:MAG: ParB/Srx family N-terminal domain-containing protein [Sphingomonas sp.]|uniref:ParB/RepB/Spo0J family partition protein n=1 Tax=Sphingomonas sp. TaxID=28214 RepID=UPI0035A988FC|nr:ParB/Srx family N-terminal domain-containing protein [Sphingomonas sp.]